MKLPRDARPGRGRLIQTADSFGRRYPIRRYNQPRRRGHAVAMLLLFALLLTLFGAWAMGLIEQTPRI